MTALYIIGGVVAYAYVVIVIARFMAFNKLRSERDAQTDSDLSAVLDGEVRGQNGAQKETAASSAL